MSGQPRVSKKLVIPALALLAVAIVAISAISGNLNLLGQQIYPNAMVRGTIIGKAFTEGKVVGNVTAVFFRPANTPSEGRGLPADVKIDRTYSIRLTNGMNYTVYLYVVNPNYDEDTGICQGQEISLSNLHQASYVFDITPVNCA